jgi:hypothetical protein
MGSTLDKFRDRNSSNVSWFPSMGSLNHLKIFLSTGSFTILFANPSRKFWSMIFFMYLHMGSSVYHPRFPPLFHTIKIQRTRHDNQIFFQVIIYQYHKDLGATDKPIFKRSKKPLWPSSPRHAQGNEHVPSGGLIVCQTLGTLGLALARPRHDWAL